MTGITTYMVCLGERQAQLIEKLTLNDVLEFYDAFLLPSSSTRSKLSIHAHPKAKDLAQFSVVASQVFLEDLKSRDVSVDDAQYTKLSAKEPSVEAVKTFLAPYLSTVPEESTTSLLARIDELARLHPVVKADEDSSLPSDVVVIGDLAKWKTALELSPPPIPYSGPDAEQDSEGTTSSKL
jgi:insulysin